MIIKEERIGGQRLILGDCMKVMPLLERFDLCLTDPPYGVNLNTDNRRFSGGNAASVSRRGNGIGPAKGKPIANDSEPFDPSPILQAGKQHIIWGWNNYPDKLPKGACLVWIKRNDEAFGSFLSDAELGWMSKGHGVYCRRDLSNNGIALERVHPTQKPVALMEWCLGFAPKAQTVLDCYMGSGTTLVACQRMGRAGTGIELDEEYWRIACERVHKAWLEPDMFIADPKPTAPQQESFLDV